MIKYFFISLFIIISSLVGLVLYIGKMDLVLNFFEKEKPTIEIIAKPQGVLQEPTTIEFSVNDDGASIKYVQVIAEQGANSYPLFKKSYGFKRIEHETYHVEIPGKKSRMFVPGDVAITITAGDKSLYRNANQRDLQFVADYDRPSITVLTAQHNANQSGAELVFYEVHDKNLRSHGVQVGEAFFPGYSAKFLDETFASKPNLYFAFFAVPFEFDSDNEVITVIAEDAVGNKAKGGFYYKVAKRKREFGETIPLDKKLIKVFSNSVQRRYWSGVFLRPRTDNVIAVNAGVVSFAGPIDGFENAVIVDHGFGLASVYASLTSLQVSVGEEVSAGDKLGAITNQGGERKYLHFEFRMQGVPVRPAEWWDALWIRDHIENKIVSIRRDLGVAQ